ncbi:MAG TPA: leucyl aminopeptidase [Halieaceae bacterium]|jgi:leucyl aminopeptidase|uniref:leucyl aminopeptidase n=2 Tax=Haliea TaxID=475794 RepID=UPI000C508DC3|nr:leucyl aminopeptidase [Haliea sp.]HAN69076.1 leucyl aminopeptidase [Halieaceae bacterium]MAY93582.1 leucyl aminopeptidase [Haliea sp.]MBK41341.1 leucyl aminopeptidase [Haliea sp.]MBP70262.1 leucyl aminopeptidase [Haliea sp.]HBM85004.1 leucyl aminopeptidase [Halieaceae bacterium]|tara:strand:+ start:6705 stop:8189 length:1485 start_codon:yes stop_codon:yes gene_type:complete
MSTLTFTARASADPSKTKTRCAIVAVFGGELSATATALDSAGALSNTLKLGDFQGKPGQTHLLPGIGNAERVMLLGCGDRARFSHAVAREAFQGLSTALNASNVTEALLHTADLLSDAVDGAWLLELVARTLTVSSYRYTRTVSKPKEPLALKKLVVNPGKGLPAKRAQAALDNGAALGRGINYTRELGNLPGNICTPSYLASEARKLSRGNSKVRTQVLEEKKMRELGMGSLLSVSAGSDEPAKLIVIEYRGGKSGAAPQVLVGKGITFDSGGISIKPGAKMDEMKYDMCGAASVLGTLQAVIDMALPLNVTGIIAAAENMPSGRATKPGDVVKSMSGTTIEVLNTDAEGRLVLCDALTFASRFKPAAVIDIATLTGACVVALGSHASAVYANDEALAEQLLSAGTDSHDRGWRMPLWDDYRKQLKSNFADLANIGGPEGGSVTAACFLATFAENYPWAHLDIAGSAWNSSPKGATGRPVAMLTRYLQGRAAD